MIKVARGWRRADFSWNFAFWVLFTWIYFDQFKFQSEPCETCLSPQIANPQISWWAGLQIPQLFWLIRKLQICQTLFGLPIWQLQIRKFSPLPLCSNYETPPFQMFVILSNHFMVKPTNLRSQACSGKCFCTNFIRSIFKVLFEKRKMFLRICGSLSLKKIGYTNRKSAYCEKKKLGL